MADVLRKGRFYAEWTGDKMEGGIFPYPNHFEVWEKIGDLDLILDRRDAENLRQLLDEILKDWPSTP